MSKNLILVLGLFVFIALGIYLFFLPKSVVNNKATMETEKSENPVASNEQNMPESSHEEDAAIVKEIQSWKEKLRAEKDKKRQSAYLASIGKSFVKNHRYDSAGYYFERASLADPVNKSYRYEAGNAYFEGIAFASNPSKIEDLSSKARKNLEQVDENNPKLADAQAKIALTFVNSEAPMKGILKLRELAEKYPKNEFIAYQLGMLSFQSGQYEKAITRFEHVLSLNPENVNACFYLAQSFVQAGRGKEAQPIIDKGLQLAREEDTKASFQELKKQIAGN